MLWAEPGMESTAPVSIPGPPQARLGFLRSLRRGQGVTPHPSSLCLPGHVLLDKTLIPSCHDNRRQWLTAGVGSGGKHLAVPTLGLNAC